jgi:hypothetical protein
MARLRRSSWLLAASVFAPLAAHAAPCANSVDELRALLGDPAFPLAWEEISMGDARPLLVTLDERAGGLFVSFVKSGEGVWAEGMATLCRKGGQAEVRFKSGLVRIGPAAGWLLRQALEGGAAIALQPTSARELNIGTLGWSGRFVPGGRSIGLKAP